MHTNSQTAVDFDGEISSLVQQNSGGGRMNNSCAFLVAAAALFYAGPRFERRRRVQDTHSVCCERKQELASSVQILASQLSHQKRASHQAYTAMQPSTTSQRRRRGGGSRILPDTTTTTRSCLARTRALTCLQGEMMQFQSTVFPAKTGKRELPNG